MPFFFATGTAVEFDLENRDSLLVIFFTTIGLSSGLGTLLKGGKPLAILLCLAITYLFIQNFIGVGVAAISGLPLEVGVVGGSVSLSGGHGTAIAWTPTFLNDYKIDGAAELGIACATFGLILGGIIGGPIANSLIARYGLESPSEDAPTVGVGHEEEAPEINADRVLRVFFNIGLAIGIGIHLNDLFEFIGLELPEFVTCLLAGIILTNTIPYLFP